MSDALIAALAGALLAAGLSYGGNWLKIGPRSSDIDVLALALIVGCCIFGSHLGRDYGYSLVGSLIGAGVGAAAATLVRTIAAR